MHMDGFFTLVGIQEDSSKGVHSVCFSVEFATRSERVLLVVLKLASREKMCNRFVQR